MLRACLPWPHKMLRSIAGDVSVVDDDIRAVWTDMIDTMEAMPGVGLAAVQIGVPLRLAVVDASDARGQVVRMANPVVLFSSEVLRAHEECKCLGRQGFCGVVGNIGAASDRPSGGAHVF
jgi:peptide deformylase